MNNRDIPADKINEKAARARGWFKGIYSQVPWWCTKDADDGAQLQWSFTYSVPEYSPLTNHNQFHEIWTPDIEAKACDVLDDWLTEGYTGFDTECWEIVEVLENGNNT